MKVLTSECSGDYTVFMLDIDTTHTSIFDQVAFCAGLPRAIIHTLENIAISIERPIGTLIQLEGDPADSMYIVVAGHVKIYRMSVAGREQILQISGPGAHFNTVALFDGGSCPANVEALTNVHLLMLSRTRLLPLLEEHPTLALALLRNVCASLRSMVNLVDKLALHTVQGRLAALLIEIAEEQEHGEDIRATTQAQMAARLGTVREMIARTLKNFEGLGLISIERGAITILDREGLVKQSEV